MRSMSCGTSIRGWALPSPHRGGLSWGTRSIAGSQGGYIILHSELHLAPRSTSSILRLCEIEVLLRTSERVACRAAYRKSTESTDTRSFYAVHLEHTHWHPIFNAARASKRVESRVGRGEASGVTTSGISVQPRTTASH